jgi:putative ABC transport system substrate-binding protein
LNVDVVRLGVQSAGDIDAVIDTAKRDRVGGLVVLRDALLITHRTRLIGLAAKHSLPAIYGMREFVDDGGLMSFEPSVPDMLRRAAGLVDRILKGARPGDLPVEQSSKFDLSLNLKTAKALGLAVPAAVRARASHVVE